MILLTVAIAVKDQPGCALSATLEQNHLESVDDQVAAG